MRKNRYIVGRKTRNLKPAYSMNLSSCAFSNWFRFNGILLTFLLCVFLTPLYAQDLSTPPDSIQTYIQKQVQLEVKEQLNWIYKIFGIVASLLTIWAAVTWFYKIKKVAEKQIEDKAGAIVDEKISEKVGVKSNLIRAYFQKVEEEQKIYGSRILVVNFDRGKKGRGAIENLLKKAGFNGKLTFWTLATFQEKANSNDFLDVNNFDLILFDNEDGLLSEATVIDIVEDIEDGLRYVSYNSVDWSDENFKAYKNRIHFAKGGRYLGSTVKDALK